MSRRGQEPSSNPAAGPAHPSFRREGGTLLSSMTVALEATVRPRGGRQVEGVLHPQGSPLRSLEMRAGPLPSNLPTAALISMNFPLMTALSFHPEYTVYCLNQAHQRSCYCQQILFPFLFPVCVAFFPTSLIPSPLPSATSHSPSPPSLVSMFAFYTVFPPHFIELLQILINLNSFIANTADIHISLNKSLTVDILYSST